MTPEADAVVLVSVTRATGCRFGLDLVSDCPGERFARHTQKYASRITAQLMMSALQERISLRLGRRYRQAAALGLGDRRTRTRSGSRREGAADCREHDRSDDRGPRNAPRRRTTPDARSARGGAVASIDAFGSEEENTIRKTRERLHRLREPVPGRRHRHDRDSRHGSPRPDRHPGFRGTQWPHETVTRREPAPRAASRVAWVRVTSDPQGWRSR